MIYLDHAATSPLLPEVKSRIIGMMNQPLGNPSSLHTIGHITNNYIVEARNTIAQAINAEPSEIIFTSCGSESNNTVIKTFNNHSIAVSAIEHPSILQPAQQNPALQIIPVDRFGIVDSLPSLSSDTRLISIMLANNEIGSINNIQKLVQEIRSIHPKAYIHTDATQAFGKISVDVKKLDVDYMTISAHKIGGPVGIGALFVKKGSPLKPLVLGGHQERGLRAGTSPVLNIIGFDVATKIITSQNTIEQFDQKVKPLRNYLAKQILTNISHSSLNHSLSSSLPNILNVSFAAAEGESIQLYLDAMHNIVVSTGSACASGDGKPSHVLMALFNDAEIAHSSIRFSLNPTNTKAEIDYVVEKLAPIIHRLQKISTIKIGETSI